jgi:hypothetical protein
MQLAQREGNPGWPLVLLWLAASAAPGLRAQAGTPPPEPDPAWLVGRIQVATTKPEHVREILQHLANQAMPVRLQALAALQRRYAADLQLCDKEHKKLLPRFAKGVPKAQRSLLGRRGDERAAQLRSQLLAISRAPDLTEERIAAEIDPLLQQLEALLLPNVEQVCQQDAALQTAVQAQRQLHEDLADLYAIYLEWRQQLDQDPVARQRIDQQAESPAPPPRADLERELAELTLTALPLSPRDQKVLATNAALAARMDREEYLGTARLNRIRLAVGLPLLWIDERLGNAARDHSVDMRTLGFFSHTSPVEGKRSVGDRCARAGTTGSAENIAAGQSTGEGAIRAWWYSPGHHRNMLGGHARTGLGRSEGLWTQLFGG